MERRVGSDFARCAVVVGLGLLSFGGQLAAKDDGVEGPGEFQQKAQALKQKYQTQRQQVMQDCRTRMQQLEQQMANEMNALKEAEHAKWSEEIKLKQQQLEDRHRKELEHFDQMRQQKEQQFQQHMQERKKD